MPENHLFEYAVIRVVPRVERGEFINIGVIVYCPKQKFLQVLFNLDKGRLLALWPGLDLDCLQDNIASFEKICHGDMHAGPIARLDMPSRFRWLTATRSTVLQSSKVHPGLSSNAAGTIKRLYHQLVL